MNNEMLSPWSISILFAMLCSFEQICEARDCDTESTRLLGSEDVAEVVVFKATGTTRLELNSALARLDPDQLAPLVRHMKSAKLSDAEPILAEYPYVLVLVGNDGRQMEAWKLWPLSKPKNCIYQVSIARDSDGFVMGDHIPSFFRGYQIPDSLDAIKWLRSLLKRKEAPEE